MRKAEAIHSLLQVPDDIASPRSKIVAISMTLPSA
jgi:hypothetical protein